MRIGVRFCGGCNPQIDREGLVEFISRNLGCLIAPIGESRSYANGVDPDLVLIINGCTAGCIKRTADLPRSVVVAGTHVDAFPVPAEKLFETVLERVKRIGKVAGGI
ncbi:MAG: hypothetical protein ACPLSY_14545 [Moorellaceae bacterium]